MINSACLQKCKSIVVSDEIWASLDSMTIHVDGNSV